MTDGPIIPAGSEKTYERFHFAPAYRVGDTVYVSGVIGSGSDGRAPEDAADEFANTFKNLTATLEACGGSLGSIVEMTSFHVGMDETLGAFMAAKDNAIEAPYPAWTAIGCTGLALPGARAEVKVTAIIPA
jgi:enamine deaminase RidA (YjgF/YER057c/UK114 family)